MNFVSLSGLLGALQVCSYVAIVVGKPVHPMGIELRIRKNLSTQSIGGNNAPVMSVREVPLAGQNTFDFPEYQPNTTTVTILEYLLDMHRQKRRAITIYKREELQKRGVVKAGSNECKKKKKDKLCEGRSKMFWNAVTKQCEACDAGKDPSPKGDKCVTPETPEEELKRGKCPPGKRLDPAVSDQVSHMFCPYRIVLLLPMDIG